MPDPRAAQNLQMPHPRDWQGRQMTRSIPEGGGKGGGGVLGAPGIDWKMLILSFKAIYGRSHSPIL